MATRRLRTRRKIDQSTSASRRLLAESQAEKHHDTPSAPNSRRPARHDHTGQRDQSLEQKVLAFALASLASRSRAEAQLRRRLTAKFGAVPEIDRCIARLKEKGYVNDSKLAESYVAHRIGVKAIGRTRLARELSKKLLSKETIDRALTLAFQSVSEDELIDRAIEKRIRSRGAPVSPADRKKMFDHLARLGFQYELILRKIQHLSSAEDLEVYEY